jgi:hypothetical protein
MHTVIDFDEVAFHDSQILGVIEATQDQTVDFSLLFPTNWEDNVFEMVTLRFYNVTFYRLDEIPFDGLPTILNIINLGTKSKSIGTEPNLIDVVRNTIEIQTNRGNRTVEFTNCELLQPLTL